MRVRARFLKTQFLSPEEGEDFVAGGGDENGVFPLGTGFVISGAGGPVIGGIDDGGADAGVDHGLDGKGHAGGKGDVDVVIVMRDLGGFVEVDADAMSDKLIDDRAMTGCSVIFDRFPNGGDRNAGL